MAKEKAVSFTGQSALNAIMKSGGGSVSKVKMGTGNEQMLAFARKHGMKDKIVKADECDATSGTSIFDPVLCEIAYRWFSPVGGLILDPFAGGSVRGIVASKLGRQYIGHELRQEQTASRAASCAAMMNSRPHGYAGTAATLTRPAPMCRPTWCLAARPMPIWRFRPCISRSLRRHATGSSPTASPAS